ncbi:hypothetical protein CERZMDRAFT_93311 [Cercospora zeae-maydis SCOH1-5]|uniref:Uncharacterized protein n=1 Tax=Cercospora zeae-maydis SCOH1-5 TaxID=717836 RepID=A0A6A6FUT3_9PEZI|nr:hypothetical protein CERZMDRAFT_93311 [Cercospora zeae-maydis SCOH1-5]
MRLSLLILSALSTLSGLSYAWEPVIDPWDSHGRFERGQKIALVRYFEPNCTTQLEQNHFKIRGVRKRQCHNFEYPFASLAFEYPRMKRRWLMVRGCRISMFQGPDCEDELPRRYTDPQEKQCLDLPTKAWSLRIEDCVFCPEEGGHEC